MTQNYWCVISWGVNFSLSSHLSRFDHVWCWRFWHHGFIAAWAEPAHTWAWVFPAGSWWHHSGVYKLSRKEKKGTGESFPAAVYGVCYYHFWADSLPDKPSPNRSRFQYSFFPPRFPKGRKRVWERQMFHSYFKYFLDSFATFNIRHHKEFYTPPPPNKCSTGMRNGPVMGHTLKSQTASAPWP